MYKTRLQEFCHKKQWSLPHYSTFRDGPNHMPRFATTVVVNGISFQHPEPSRSTKESQNEAAKIALDHFAGPRKPPAVPPVIAPQPSPPVPPQGNDNSSGSLGMSDMLANLGGPRKAPAEPPVIAPQPAPLVPPQTADNVSGSLGMSDMLANLGGPRKAPTEPPVTPLQPAPPVPPQTKDNSSGSLGMSDMLANLGGPRKDPAEPPVIAPQSTPPVPPQTKDNLSGSLGMCDMLTNLGGPRKAPTEPPVIAPQPTPPVPPQTKDNLSGSLGMSDMLASLEELQPKLPEEYPSSGMKMVVDHPIIETTPSEECCAPQANQSSNSVKDDSPIRDVWHLSKNQLQMYAQKRNLPLPTYSCEREGPPQASRFKCKVTIDGKTFEGPDYCNTLKDAEHAAARIALLTLSSNEDQERDSGLYKNLLQEFAQKEGYHLPVYETNGSFGHCPSFTSTVVIEGESFTGRQGRTKKQAEMDAARVAYTLLKERKRCRTSTSQSPAHQGPRVFSSSTSSQPHTTTSIPPNIGSRGSAVSNFNLLTKTETVDTEHTESKNHHIPLPSHESATSTLRSGNPSLSNTIYAQLRNPTLEESMSRSSSPSETGNMLPAAAVSTTESPGEAVSLPPRGVVRVYSRALNVRLPEGSVVERSDDKWVAVIADPDPNRL